jgi:hypothetical protein
MIMMIFFIVLWIELDEKGYMWRNDYDYMNNEENLMSSNNALY